jgi:NDP-hexose 2,3-enoyl reductase
MATKVFNPSELKSDIPEPNHNGTNLSAVKIRKHCDASLKRLQTDYIDLYQMHHVDRNCPWDETWQAFDSLTKQGKLYIQDPVILLVGTLLPPIRKQ